jgi:hypothetical protein
LERAYAKLTLHRTYAAARLGDHVRAIADAEALVRSPTPLPASFYHAACWYSLASAAIGKESRPGSSQHGQLSDRYARRALDLLQQARAAGYFGPTELARLRHDPDLDPVRTREDFMKLLSDLETKVSASRG